MCDLQACYNKTEVLPPMKIDAQQRRLFLQGLVALPLAFVLASPELAKAAAERLDDVTLALADGTQVSAALALPDEADNAPTVLLIHEWWGLNDQIKAVAAELADMGYIALAVDLYGGAPAATTPEGAQALMAKMDPSVASETLVAWINYLKKHEKASGKVGTLGWCFGGGWSLNASIATPVDATVIYYGNVTPPADALANLQGPVIGHFGKQDKNINTAMVEGFEAAMAEAGKQDALTVYWYDADHAFANPSGARYDEEDAKLAWERTTEFLAEQLA